MKLTKPLLRGVSVKELFLASRDPDISIGTSPFGLVENGGTAYIKTYGSPYAKGVHISQPGPLAGFGRSHARGTVIVMTSQGLKKMPRAAAENLRKGKKGRMEAPAVRGGRRRGGEELGF